MRYHDHNNSEFTHRWVWESPTQTPAPTLSERPKKREVSDRVKAWYEEIDTWEKEFIQSINEDVEGADGLFKSSFTVGESNEFRRLMVTRLKSTVKVLKQRVQALDDLNPEEDVEVFDQKVEGILDQTQKGLYALKDEVVNAGRGIGALGGEDTERIDTKHEAWLFEQNLAQFYEEMETPAGRTKFQKKSEKLVPKAESLIGPQNGLITKIQEGVRLTPQDYDQVIDGLTNVWGQRIEMKNKVTQRDSYKLLERTSALLPLHVMSPIQRLNLAERMANRFSNQPEKIRHGVLFLANLSFLDMEQTEQLLKKNGQALNEQDKRDIQLTRQAVKDAQKVFEKIYGKSGGKNLFLEHGTGSNFLIYEVAGRVAAAGALIPLIINIGSPSKIPDILTDPAWLACVGIGAASVEHVTGGMGEGAVTEQLLAVGDGPDEMTQEEANDRREIASQKKLDDLCGNHPETVQWLIRDGGAILKDIDTIAQDKEVDMAEGYYLFQFDDLIDYKVEEAKQSAKADEQDWDDAKEAAKKAQLNRLYKQPRDGVDVGGVQEGIQGMYHVLAHELALTDVRAMLREIEESRDRRGIE